MPTELEHAILGVVFLDQPCTAYAVRTAFEASLSARWTASAGSIYPAIRRLVSGGLLRETPRRGDRRNASLLELTGAGAAALRAWLSAPLPPADELVPADPLRTRLRFLAALSSREALAALADAREKLEGLLATVRGARRSAQADGEELLALTHRAAERAIRAQLDSLADAARVLTQRGLKSRSP